MYKAIEGPYRTDPDHPCDIQTHDGSREVGNVTPDFAMRTGLKEGEDEATAKLLAASWCMRELLRQIQSENSILSDATVEDINRLLKELP